MTLAGRNTTIRTVLFLCIGVNIGVAYALFRTFRGADATTLIDLRFLQLVAIGGTTVSVLLGALFAILYVRLFRRSPSIPVFFLTFFFLSMMLDVSKVGQVVVLSSRWPHLSPVVARGSIFGHIVGVFSLFAAGLYSGGIRMQRHGTVLFIGFLIAFSLSWLIPVDTSYLPDHLVYPAGVRASLEVALIGILVLAVVNFVQAAVSNENPRLLVTAGAVAALAVGRELLFYYADPLWIIVGGALVIIGSSVFTGQHYRDYLVS
ncbi:MAG: hypothetical protein PF508_12480 [Spirochaeta sp.]|jgi:hypothetical protein|nr:hypothetical protein [Spirochaeta sp.]